MQQCPQPDFTGLVAAAIALASAITLLIRAYIDNRALKQTVVSQGAMTRNTVKQETGNISINETPVSPLENVDFPHEKF